MQAALRLALALTLILAATVPGQLQVPANDGWVTDLAGVLDEARERDLERLMESYRQGSSHDVALLTVKDLGGRGLEEFALAVARAWKIGGKDLHNGALLVVAKDERKLRIEVGRGLEGVLTDSISGRIIRDVIAPKLRQGRWHDGLEAGIRTIHAAAGGGYATPPAGAPAPDVGCFLPGLVLIFLLLPLILGARRRRGRVGRGASAGAALGGFWTGLGGWHQGGFSSGRGGAFSGGGFGGFGGGGGFSGGGASGGW